MYNSGCSNTALINFNFSSFEVCLKCLFIIFNERLLATSEGKAIDVNSFTLSFCLPIVLAPQLQQKLNRENDSMNACVKACDRNIPKPVRDFCCLLKI